MISLLLSSSRITMSLSAKGFIRSVPGVAGRFVCTFLISNILYSASGSFATAVPEFISDDATLKYDSVGDLTSTRSFSGRVGIDDIALIFRNGPTITGRLSKLVNPPSDVSGSAVWH
jgi:hypothetical protein